LERVELLPAQEEVFQTLQVHSQQGGLCLVLGEPGTGKSVVKEAVRRLAEDKRIVVACVGRTMHTYWHTVKLLCRAFGIEEDGSPVLCEKKLIEEAWSLNRTGKSLITVVDDAHLMEIETLRRLRLLFEVPETGGRRQRPKGVPTGTRPWMAEQFPKNHNVILMGQPELLSAMSLKVHEDIKSRVTYSVVMRKLSPEDMEKFLFGQLDRSGLAHKVFSEDALHLVVRNSEGVLRRARNLAVGCLLEAVRAQSREVTLDLANRVLLQPHWREHFDVVQG
jgi:type II secretory pathway predicted ATPase ExeA